MNIARVLAAVLLVSPVVVNAGDPTRGNTLYHSTYQCNACHVGQPTSTTDIVVNGGGSAAVIVTAIQSILPMRRYAQTLANSPTDLDDIAAYLAQFVANAPAATQVVEYYHAAFDHYFVTLIGGEIAGLDAGTIGGWVRTGFSFKGYAAPVAGAATVCRFFSTAFAPKSSHFYTAFPEECATVKASADWTYEGDVMYLPTPAADGTCAAGTVPVYRLYNNGQGGAPNHRFTVDPAQRDAMLAQGWVLEGNAPGFAMMCAPA
jgi:hypothetical protein